MNEALVKEVFSDEEFVKSLFQLETPQEVQTAMSGKGIELTVEQIVQIKDLILKRLYSGNELSEEDLQDVTGGSFVAVGLIIFIGIGLSSAALTGALVGGAWAVDSSTNHGW